MQIHTIVTDLDGTFLNKNSKISSFNKEIIQKAIDKGIHFMIATGRRFYSTNRFALEFDRPLDLVCNNGQILRRSMTGEKIQSNYFSEKIAKEIIYFGKKNGLKPVLHVDMYEEGIDMILESHTSNSEYHQYTGGKNDRVLQVKDCIDISLVNTTVICFLNKDMQVLEKFKFQLENHFYLWGVKPILTTIHQIGPCLEIILKGISKWSGIQKYMQIHSRSEQGILSFGDEANDLEMVQNATIGVAMQNAVSQVKEVASIISKYTNEEDGVARTILELGIIF